MSEQAVPKEKTAPEQAVPKEKTAPEQTVPKEKTTKGKSKTSRLAAAISAKAGVHSNGLIGGIGLKALDPDLLCKMASKPKSRASLAGIVNICAQKALEKAKIAYGVKEEELQKAIDEFIDKLTRGEAAVVARKVALGEAPEEGEGPRIEYTLNYLGKPFHELATLKPGSTRKRCTVVHSEDTVAILHPAIQGKPGTSVQGESVPPTKGASTKTISLEEISGDRTVISGKNLLAECDGVCEEDAQGNLRVIPEIVLPQVDDSTGHVPETGISRANVVIEGDIKGQGVATTENLFVGSGKEGGTIESRASIQARNLILNGRAVGEGGGRIVPIQVEELCAVKEVVNRAISARNILVARDSRFSRLDGETSIWVDGNLYGGMISPRNFLQVKGNLGTEAGESRTRIVLPAEATSDQRKRKIAKALKNYKDQMEELRAKLEELDKNSDKRAKVDPYWAKLAQGERAAPQGPMQMKGLQQFAEFIGQKQQLGHKVKGVKRALARLAEEKKETEEDSSGNNATIIVGGTLYLDVRFEISRELDADAGELPVSFTHEGKQFMQSTLTKAASALRKEVNTYREKKDAAIGEKQKAIDQMFEGQEKKPTVEEKEDQEFKLPITWLEVEAPKELEINSMLYVRSSEPQKTIIRTTARIREPQTNVTVVLQAEGAKGTFSISPSASDPKNWAEDDNIKGDLESIAIRDMSALDLLNGKSFPDADSP